MNKTLKPPPYDAIVNLIRTALQEDLGTIGDITTEWIVPESQRSSAHVVVKEEGVIAGQEVARAVFREVDSATEYEILVADGERVAEGSVIATVSGRARGVLTAERTALNLLGRLAGIATLTAEFVRRIEGCSAHILDTRKTTPGLRLLEKYAVRAGGGQNHRIGLFDMALIKENHIRACGSITEAIRGCRKHGAAEKIRIEVETTTLAEVQEALDVGVDRIMLDNMPIPEMKKCVELVRGRVEVEASGNVRLDNVRQIAETGVDFISIGTLTHSACALDVSLMFVQ